MSPLPDSRVRRRPIGRFLSRSNNFLTRTLLPGSSSFPLFSTPLPDRTRKDENSPRLSAAACRRPFDHSPNESRMLPMCCQAVPAVQDHFRFKNQHLPRILLCKLFSSVQETVRLTTPCATIRIWSVLAEILLIKHYAPTEFSAR